MATKSSLVHRLVDAAQNQKNLTADQENTRSQATHEQGFAKNRAPSQLEIIPQGNPWPHRWSTTVRKSHRTLEACRTNRNSQSDAARTNIKNHSTTNRRGQDQIYRGSIHAEEKTRRHVVFWDGIAVNRGQVDRSKIQSHLQERHFGAAQRSSVPPNLDKPQR